MCLEKTNNGELPFFPPPNIPVSVSSGTETRCFKQRAESCSAVHRWVVHRVCCAPLLSELHQTKKTPQIFTALQSITGGFWASTQSWMWQRTVMTIQISLIDTYVYFSLFFFFVLLWNVCSPLFLFFLFFSSTLRYFFFSKTAKFHCIKFAKNWKVSIHSNSTKKRNDNLRHFKTKLSQTCTFFL